MSEYAGEVVSTEEAQRRWRDEYDRAGLNYLLVVREFMYALCFPSMIFNTRLRTAHARTHAQTGARSDATHQHRWHAVGQRVAVLQPLVRP